MALIKVIVTFLIFTLTTKLTAAIDCYDCESFNNVDDDEHFEGFIRSQDCEKGDSDTTTSCDSCMTVTYDGRVWLNTTTGEYRPRIEYVLRTCNILSLNEGCRDLSSNAFLSAELLTRLKLEASDDVDYVEELDDGEICVCDTNECNTSMVIIPNICLLALLLFARIF